MSQMHKCQKAFFVLFSFSEPVDTMRIDWHVRGWVKVKTAEETHTHTKKHCRNQAFLKSSNTLTVTSGTFKFFFICPIIQTMSFFCSHNWMLLSFRLHYIRVGWLLSKYALFLLRDKEYYDLSTLTQGEVPNEACERESLARLICFTLV